jgi:hypothetical protein
MGIFDSDSEEEVKISPEDEPENTSRLKDEVETEIMDDSNSEKSSRGQKIMEKSRQKTKDGKKSVGSSDVSLEDVHRQNKRIIELLESIAGEDIEEDDQEDVTGDLDGVL